MRRFRRLPLCACLLIASFVSAQIPSPESHLGFRVGEDRKMADWDQVVSYFQKVAAAAPDRVHFEELGKTTMGKPFVAVTITSADNMKNLPRYLQIQQRLADPRGLDPAEAEKLIHEGKAVVLLTCTVHSTEVASTQTSLEYVYKLLTEDTPEHRQILDNVILLLVPSLNPDGQDMVVQWYRKYVGTPFEGSSPVELYHKYVGHDDNRDWYMFTQVESQLTVGKLHNVWHPEVVYDVHQMGANAARMFVPPFLDPVDPNVDPIIIQEINGLGASMAADLATNGKQGVAINAMYDFWSPARHYQAYHAGLRILTESASARLATPARIRFSDLDTNALGYNAQRASWNFPDLWRGGDWHLRDIVDYQLITYESLLHHVAESREMYVRNFYRVGKREVERTGAPFAYVIPAQQKDLPATAKMLNTLRMGMVEVQRAKADFTADGIQYPAGTWAILMAQPYGGYAKTLLERQHYPDLREYPGGPPKRPYDVTAQTLPLLMGVNAVEVDRPFQADFEKVDKVELPLERFDAKSKAYLMRSDSNNAFIAVNRLLKAGAPVARLRAAVKDHGLDFPAGTFVVRSQAVAQLASLGVVTSGTDLPLADAVPLKSPRIGVYTSYQASMDEGWTRWVMEQFEFPYARMYDKDMRAGNLNDRFDVIVIPDEGVNGIVNGNRRRGDTGAEEAAAPAGRGGGGGGVGAPAVPDEFTGGIGAQGVANLKAFVTEGGTLVTLNSASDFAMERLGVGARNLLSGVANKDFYGPGSLLRVNVDPNHPIGYGMDHEAAIWFEHSPAFAASFDNPAGDAVSIATYPPNGNPLMSGWLLGDQLLQNRSAALDAPLGHGHVVMFGFRPQYRGQSYGTFKMFFNSLFYYGAMAQPAAQKSGSAGAQVPSESRTPADAATLKRE